MAADSIHRTSSLGASRNQQRGKLEKESVGGRRRETMLKRLRGVKGAGGEGEGGREEEEGEGYNKPNESMDHTNNQWIQGEINRWSRIMHQP